MKKFLIILFLIVIGFETGNAQIGTYAGAFTRMGFSARGMSMGNTMVSDIFGDINGVYNPAASTFQEKGIVNLGYTFLSLDRKLNVVGFTKKFKLKNQEKGGAGITIAWINAGVSDIDGRDNDGESIGTFSTFENEFYLGTAFLIDERLSLGLGFKLYYSKLFDEITESSFALDLGAVYQVNPKLALGVVYKDLGAKYEWQTTEIYGSNGNTTTDKFPKTLELGGTYQLPKNFGLVSLALQQLFAPNVETNNVTVTPSDIKSNSTALKIGTEIRIVDNVKFRAGLERMDFSADDFTGNLKPSFGLGLNKSFSQNTSLGVDYSFQLEPYTHDPIQNIGLVFKFK